MKSIGCAWLIMRARFRSLSRADTRTFEVYSAMSKICWAMGYFLVPVYPPQSSFGRVDDYLQPHVMASVLVPFAVFHLGAILMDNGRLRRGCIMIGVAWWSWLSFLMLQFPPNWSAGILYVLIALFGIWSFLAARLRNEVVTRHHGNA